MSDAFLSFVVLIGFYLVVPFLIVVLVDRWRRPSAAHYAECSRRFRERLLCPDFSAIEQHFGRPLPECVQALYARHDEVTRYDFEVISDGSNPLRDRWPVACYRPADGESIGDLWQGLEQYFAFANDGFGSDYLIDPQQEDPAVLFHDLDTGELLQVSDRFTQFMNWQREPMFPEDAATEFHQQS